MGGPTHNPSNSNSFKIIFNSGDIFGAGPAAATSASDVPDFVRPAATSSRQRAGTCENLWTTHARRATIKRRTRTDHQNTPRQRQGSATNAFPWLLKVPCFLAFGSCDKSLMECKEVWSTRAISTVNRFGDAATGGCVHMCTHVCEGTCVKYKLSSERI